MKRILGALFAAALAISPGAIHGSPFVPGGGGGGGGAAAATLLSFTPTVNTGTPSCVPTPLGGSIYGGYLINGFYTAATCFNGLVVFSALPAATNGYTCVATDLTTPTGTVQETLPLANTTATFLANTTAGDIISYTCAGP